MSKKHFEWAAQYVRAMVANGEPEARIFAALTAFRDLFQEFGPRFDETRFVNACATDGKADR